MFMKIFTLIIIGFSNILTTPQNIKNDEITTQSIIRNRRQSNKVYDFEIRNLEKVQFWTSKQTHNITQVNIFKKDNSNLDQKLPKLKNLNNLTLIFTKELQNNQSKQDEIKQLIITRGQEIKQSNDFEIEIEKDITDIDLPITTTKFYGNYKYNDVVDNLDYLMIHHGDFDKFNYSYLYWTPVFNFIDTLEKGYYKEFAIKNQGFKNESYFYHKSSTSEDKINENVLKIKAFNKTLIAGNNYLQLLHGETEIWKYDTKSINYLNVRFSFLRYDPDLKNDIYLYFKNNIPSINNSDYKNGFWWNLRNSLAISLPAYFTSLLTWTKKLIPKLILRV